MSILGVPVAPKAAKKLPIIRLRKPKQVVAKGDSIWIKSKGVFTVNRAKVNYEGEKLSLDPKNAFDKPHVKTGHQTRQHISVDVYGPNSLPFWYTDSGVVQAVKVIFKARLLTVYRAADLMLSWSEQGMQGVNHWNFDVTLFWK